MPENEERNTNDIIGPYIRYDIQYLITISENMP